MGFMTHLASRQDWRFYRREELARFFNSSGSLCLDVNARGLNGHMAHESLKDIDGNFLCGGVCTEGMSKRVGAAFKSIARCSCVKFSCSSRARALSVLAMT